MSKPMISLLTGIQCTGKCDLLAARGHVHFSLVSRMPCGENETLAVMCGGVSVACCMLSVLVCQNCEENPLGRVVFHFSTSCCVNSGTCLGTRAVCAKLASSTSPPSSPSSSSSFLHQRHIYNLMRKDSYQRFILSDDYTSQFPTPPPS